MDKDKIEPNRIDDDAQVTPDEPEAEYVGRVAGQDEGYAGETGAERRGQEAERG